MARRQTSGFIIKISLDHMDYRSLMIFEKMVASKGELIKMCFDIYDLPMEYDEGALIIRWFENKKGVDKRVAIAFIKAMLEKAKTSNGNYQIPFITNNPKRAFNRFLFNIGLGGRDEKNTWLRKELLKNMKGSYERIPPDDSDKKVYTVRL